MTKHDEITERQIKLIKSLDRYKKDVWSSDSTAKLISIGKSVLSEFVVEDAAKIYAPDGSYFVNNRGRNLILDVLKSDIINLENKTYSDLSNEKFAIACTLVLLMGVFVNISTAKMLEIIDK